MKKEINKEVIKQWEEATNHLMHFFAEKYFGKDYEQFWVSDNIGDVCFINDCFFTVENMCDFLKYRYSNKDMFAWYYGNIASEGKTFFCIRDFREVRKGFGKSKSQERRVKEMKK
jgi:hypothetical protein